ncbi:MAG: hypothetical protein PHO63_03015 [Bacilli bacterium]|nr:hypothetical protein [Bacilli bacterium]MDD4809221.1 hypothetical protein [Bacilli bacterium]
MKKRALPPNILLNILNQEWASYQDIMALGRMGISKASFIKKDIHRKLKDEGYDLSNHKVPMQVVIKRLRINVDRLKQQATNTK